MKAENLRRTTKLLPLPGYLIRNLINRYDANITYPHTPLITTVNHNFGRFEIRNLHDYIQRNIYFLGYYELRETRLTRRYLRPGDIFIDIGANIGWFTVLAANRVGASGKVFAFEPSSRIYEHLQKNMELNPYKNIKLQNIALSDKNDTAVLKGILNSNEGGGSIVYKYKSSDFIAETVQTLRFDEYFKDKNLQRIRLVKIDVEGAEMMVLKGMGTFLERKMCDYLIVEVSEVSLREVNSSTDEVLTLLRDCGYSLFRIGMFGNKLLKTDEKISSANILAEATK